MPRQRQTTLAEVLKNASDHTLQLNGFIRKGATVQKVSIHSATVKYKKPTNKGPKLKHASEHDEQVKLFEQAATDPLLSCMFAIPNGGHRSKATAGRLKAEGVKSGVPDIFLPIASRGFHGMFIEMKVGYNKPTDNQTQWMKDLTVAGYYCTVCYSADEAMIEIVQYIGNTVR